MAARSGGRRKVCCASSLDPGTHHTLQDKKSSAKTAAAKHPNEDASRSGQDSAGANEAGQVHFFLMMVHVTTTAHVVLGDQFISTSTIGREGAYNGTHYFPLTYVVRLMVDQHQEGSPDATFSFRFPAWILCIRSRVQDGTH